MAIIKVDLISYKGVKMANADKINFDASKTAEIGLYKEEECEA